MVAAYVLGYKVTPADTLASTNIKAAQGPDDIGVTICYNSVSDVKYIQPVVAAPCAFCINPVNWRTDEVLATLHDTITVSVAQKEKVLVVKGYLPSWASLMWATSIAVSRGCTRNVWKRISRTASRCSRESGCKKKYQSYGSDARSRNRHQLSYAFISKKIPIIGI